MNDGVGKNGLRTSVIKNYAITRLAFTFELGHYRQVVEQLEFGLLS